MSIINSDIVLFNDNHITILLNDYMFTYTLVWKIKVIQYTR